MVKLFMKIIKFCAKAARYFARNTFARWLRNVVTADDGTSALTELSTADEGCSKFANVKYLSTLLKIQEDTKANIEQLIVATRFEKEQKRVHDMLDWVSTAKVDS